MFFKLMKRCMDIILSAIFLILLSPFMLLIVIPIRIDSKGPAIFKQERITKGERIFIMYKFRSLVLNARKFEDQGIPTERLITRVGRYLREPYLDELPQLFNILKGEMSFVGSRALMTEDYKRHCKGIEGWKRTAKLKAGLTGLDKLYEYMPEKRRDAILKSLPDQEYLKKDKNAIYFYYMDHPSLWLDIKILFWTAELFLRKLISTIL